MNPWPDDLLANHSHVCGINSARGIHSGIPCESFPRMWDQLSLFLIHAPIPSNHSHVCGINCISFSAHLFVFESFPRMWDQHTECPRNREKIRIIPTYVGSTQRRYHERRKIPNHSHVCGINAHLMNTHLQIPESFPRMWDQPDW